MIREIPLIRDSNCTPTPGDLMPTRVNDYLCARSLEPFNRNTVRICHVIQVLKAQNQIICRETVDADFSKKKVMVVLSLLELRRLARNFASRIN